jgi:hypothetical protein
VGAIFATIAAVAGACPWRLLRPIWRPFAGLGFKVSTISPRAAAIACAHQLGAFEPRINESVKAVKSLVPADSVWLTNR